MKVKVEKAFQNILKSKMKKHLNIKFFCNDHRSVGTHP